jgi:glycosyltransferase involved in cell wall biosynthesis
VNAPEITVVIPTRDRFSLLVSAGLPSALAQEDVDLDVIVVDDGSTDGTPDRVTALREDRVRVIRTAGPRGVAAARNAGIRAAEAPWIAFLDDDDRWSPRKLATQLGAARDARASFAYAGVVVLSEVGTATEIMQAPAAEGLRSRLLRQNCMPAGSSNVIAETALVRDLGGFDEHLSYLADWDLWINLALSAQPAACAEVLVAYVRHAGRMRLGGREAMAELDRLRKRHGEAGFNPDGGRLLSWVASEHRVAGRRLQALEIYARAVVAYREPRWLTQIASTIVDRRGAGLKRLLSRQPEPMPVIAKPEWLRSS